MKIKAFIISLFIFAVVVSIGLCVARPQMHNQISFNVVDYLIKFNKDGSMTTTKQVTTEEFKEVQK